MCVHGGGGGGGGVICMGRVRCFVWEGCLVWGEGCCVSVCGKKVLSQLKVDFTGQASPKQ